MLFKDGGSPIVGVLAVVAMVILLAGNVVISLLSRKKLA